MGSPVDVDSGCPKSHRPRLFYLPDDLKRTYDTIQKPFEDELRQLKAKLVNLKSARLEN